MKENEITKIAKEAYVLSEQLREMRESMDKDGDNYRGYVAYARTYSAHLARSKEILKLDPSILRTIDQLAPYDPAKQRGFSRDFYQMKTDVPVLLAALRSFFEFNFLKKEKEQMGFVG